MMLLPAVASSRPFLTTEVLVKRFQTLIVRAMDRITTDRSCESARVRYKRAHDQMEGIRGNIVARGS